MAVFGVVTGHELVQVFTRKRIGLQREIHVGAQVVNPELFRPRGFGGWLAVEEDDIGLDALGVEEAGRETQQGMDVAFVEQFAAHHLPRPTLEQDIVGHDHGSRAVHIQDRADVLDKVQLLDTGRGTEVLADDVLRLAADLALVGDEGDAGFLAEGRIGQNHVKVLSGVGGQAVADVDGTLATVDSQYRDLITTLLGTRPLPPPVSSPRVTRQMPPTVVNSVQSQASEPSFEPITIVGIIVDEVSTPLGDGTRGSALYNVPFRLSSDPPFEWAELFVASWNHPPRYTSMHRPGIASVSGNTIHLDGTTIDEIRQYHRDTLILAAQEANSKYLELLKLQQREQQREQQRIDQHKQNVKDTAKNIKFNE